MLGVRTLAYLFVLGMGRKDPIQSITDYKAEDGFKHASESSQERVSFGLYGVCVN